MSSTLRRMLAFVTLVVMGTLVIPAAALSPDRSSPRQIAGEPHVITGSYITTNPIYPTIGADTGVVLYDLAGQVRMDFDFQSPPSAQVLGTLDGDIVSGSYTLSLPDTPNGTLLDFDGDPLTPPAVQVFGTVTFIEYLGGPYIDRGEMPLDLSVRLDPMTFQVVGGTVIVWSADDGELFPASAGPDGAVFTADDPLMELPAGWSVVELDGDPFTVIRDETVDVTIVESMGGLNDYSDMSYLDAWNTLFQRTQETYPFTVEKGIDWDAIYGQITPLVKAAQSTLDFHLVMAQFGSLIPDTHVGYVSLSIMQSFLMGGVGISKLEVTDAGEVVVVSTTQGFPADKAGITVGSVLTSMDSVPALRALDETPLLLTSASTPQGRRFLQAATMLQGPVGSSVDLAWRTPDGADHTTTLTRVADFSAILTAFGGSLAGDVIQSRMLASGVGYIKITGFAEEVSAADAMFGDALQDLVDEGAQGIILDMRDNSGGLVQLAMAMTGRFFPDYRRLFDFYYADGQGNFAYRGYIEILKSEPYYDGPVAVLVDAMTGSAGDLFTYAMHVDNRALIVGHTPTGGFAGEVGDGQYELPGGLQMQIPTGRPVDPVTGATLLEGRGVPPDVRVPLTVESILSPQDEVLQAAEDALLER
jgi:C-terminal processing protease CtpA/Prc